MYLFTITTYPNEMQKEDKYDKFEDAQDGYIGTLINNGQILVNDGDTIFSEDKYITHVLAPEKESFDSKYNNRYVNEFYEKIMKLSRLKPKFKLIGESSDYGPSCNCESSSWYMLNSYYSCSESPVVCGDCECPVPLYKLPKILEEDEYYTVFSWQKAYNACDMLFMQGIGEKSAYQRMIKPSSDLSKQGIKICSAFEKAVKKPFYYYLFRYYSPHKPTCPVCGQPWELGEGNKLFIDYRCDNCRLVGDKIKKK